MRPTASRTQAPARRATAAADGHITRSKNVPRLSSADAVDANLLISGTSTQPRHLRISKFLELAASPIICYCRRHAYAAMTKSATHATATISPRRPPPKFGRGYDRPRRYARPAATGHFCLFPPHKLAVRYSRPTLLFIDTPLPMPPPAHAAARSRGPHYRF